MAWPEQYLEALRAEPTLSRRDLAEQLGIPEDRLRARLQTRKDVRDQEAGIRADYAARQRLDEIAAGREPQQPGADIPEHLQRFLEVFQETRRRVETMEQLAEEGIDLTWADVMEGVARYPLFARALGDLLDRRKVLLEDKLDEAIEHGSSWAVRKGLEAEMPAKYGNRVRVEVQHQHQLMPHHTELVADVKAAYIKPMRAQSLSAAPEDVVEGEVVS